jgi:polyhydroxyalkanoate synthesis regulator phasin
VARTISDMEDAVRAESNARTEKIDNAVSKAGELIGVLLKNGEVTPEQARVLVTAAVRASVPNFKEHEIRDSAQRIAGELERYEN